MPRWGLLISKVCLSFLIAVRPMQATVLNTIRNKPTNNLKIDYLSMRKQKSKKWTNLISVTKLVSEENVTWSHVFCTPIFKWRICSSALASCSTTPLTPNPYPHLRKSNSRILVDTNLIPWRLISDLPDAISQYAEYPHIHWRGMGGGAPLGQNTWWALNHRGENGVTSRHLIPRL